MPYFLAVQTPLQEPGVEIRGPFADRLTAASQQSVAARDGQPSRIIEAADAAVAQRLARAAFDPGAPDA
jgi:hypothetical protein